jgi:hypothetical protein
VTNKEFAQKDSLFKSCCEAVSLEPTRRQASKYRSGKGKAYKAKYQTKKEGYKSSG